MIRSCVATHSSCNSLHPLPANDTFLALDTWMEYVSLSLRLVMVMYLTLNTRPCTKERYETFKLAHRAVNIKNFHYHFCPGQRKSWFWVITKNIKLVILINMWLSNMCAFLVLKPSGVWDSYQGIIQAIWQLPMLENSVKEGGVGRPLGIMSAGRCTAFAREGRQLHFRMGTQRKLRSQSFGFVEE